MTERRNVPEDLAPLAELRDAKGKPLRSKRTLQRWETQGPPPSIKKLLETDAGRRALLRWVEAYASKPAA